MLQSVQNKQEGIFRYEEKFLIAAGLATVLLVSGCSFFAPREKRVVGTYPLKNCRSGGSELKGVRVDRILVRKSGHKMYLYHKGKVIETMPVSLGKNASKGPKLKRGDFRTPTGKYTIVGKRCHPVKYRALYLSYPNARDRARAAKQGVHPGDLITIHAQPYWNRDGHGDAYTLRHDWTNGCIAVTNKDMDYLWQHVPIGTPIELQD
jgi:murein L,D-transpeptidase YafK